MIKLLLVGFLGAFLVGDAAEFVGIALFNVDHLLFIGLAVRGPGLFGLLRLCHHVLKGRHDLDHCLEQWLNNEANEPILRLDNICRFSVAQERDC